MDHAVFRSWCPDCVKGRAEACGRKKGADGGDVPTVSLYFMHARSEQEKDAEKGMPIVVVKDKQREDDDDGEGGAEQGCARARGGGWSNWDATR